MNKIKISIILLLALFTCACKGGTVSPRLESVTFNAHVFYFDKEYAFSCDIQSKNNATITLISPELISGAKVVVTEQGAYMEYKDIKYSVDLARAKGAPYFLLSVINDAKTKKGVKKGDKIYVDGVWQEKDYQMLLSGSGIPLKITSDNIEIEIMDAKIIKSR